MREEAEEMMARGEGLDLKVTRVTEVTHARQCGHRVNVDGC